MVAIPDPSRIRTVLDPSPVESDSDWATLPAAPASPMNPEDDPTSPFYIRPIPPRNEWPTFLPREDRYIIDVPTDTEKKREWIHYTAAVMWSNEDAKAGVVDPGTAEARRQRKAELNREAVRRWRERQRDNRDNARPEGWTEARALVDSVEDELAKKRHEFARISQELAEIKLRLHDAQQKLIRLER